MTSLEAVLLLDNELASAPPDVAEQWRVVRGWLRRRDRPSQTNLEPAAPSHFAKATEILKQRG